MCFTKTLSEINRKTKVDKGRTVPGVVGAEGVDVSMQTLRCDLRTLCAVLCGAVLCAVL